MTDVNITAPTSILPRSLLRLKLPKLALGSAVAETSKAIMQAFEMAYVTPLNAVQHKPSTVLDEDHEGRDPNW